MANLLGAAALGISGSMLAQVREASGASTSGAAALVVLDHVGSMSVSELGRDVGLTQPAAARMVDGLSTAGLVRRRTGAGRTVPVELTDAGRQVVRRVLEARARELANLLSDLDTSERAGLTAILETLLARMFAEDRRSSFLCRLCDRHTCTTAALCPVGQAERDLEQ
ncbi:MarR family winged helix-turn-helix transcriptional regulator [Ornithinicoccus halotolerans]|uniref:MarR family winged helix-turn-helix transcriptional regulator n=1 Tax=Ornithinicoccus halotolerans TaxID=1748220 RepID=UPI001E51BD08|nr:MarR family transcriptional regulator [Ornithinicoccus halotolerans]